MSYTICSRFKREHIVYAGYTMCTSREHIVYGAFCGSTTHTAAAKFIDKCLFCYFEFIVFVCIDVLRRCHHFCSHDATFPCPPRLNQYL